MHHDSDEKSLFSSSRESRSQRWTWRNYSIEPRHSSCTDSIINAQAWVPTTSIYSQTDQVIQPENNTPLATSFLRGAANIYIQTYCPLLPFLHEDHLFANISFQILKFALASPNLVASPREVATLFRSGAIKCDLSPAPGLGPVNVLQVKGAIATSLGNFANADYWVDAEPPARAYVATTPDNPMH